MVSTPHSSFVESRFVESPESVSSRPTTIGSTTELRPQPTESLIHDSNLLLLFRANVLLECAKAVAPFSPRRTPQPHVIGIGGARGMSG
jgi:hypothetical protein